MIGNFQSAGLTLGALDGMLGRLFLVDAPHFFASGLYAMGEMQEMMQRIEQLSKREHDLIQEAYPAVGEIKESVGDMADAVSGQIRPTVNLNNN